MGDSRPLLAHWLHYMYFPISVSSQVCAIALSPFLTPCILRVQPRKVNLSSPRFSGFFFSHLDLMINDLSFNCSLNISN